MIEDELVKIWQSSPNQERVKFEKSRLMIGVQSTLDELHKKIKYRDLREQLAIIVISPAFGYWAYKTPFIVTKIASVLIVLWGIYVALRLRRAKKHKPTAFTETYLEYLYKSRGYLNIQKQLLESVLYWYILPMMIFLFLFVLGPGVTPERLPVIIRSGAIFSAIGVGTYFLNKRAVRKELMPRLEKIDELIRVLERS